MEKDKSKRFEIVNEEVDGVCLTYLCVYRVFEPHHTKYTLTRLFDKGDYCEWPTCNLSIQHRPKRGIRVLNNSDT